MDSHIRINACIGTVGAGRSGDGAAVDYQPAVGVDAITFAGFAGDSDGQVAAVDRGNGNSVLIGVDAVIAGRNLNITAVDGKMQFAVQTFVFGTNVQYPGVFVAAVNIQGAFGIKGTVIFV